MMTAKFSPLRMAIIAAILFPESAILPAIADVTRLATTDSTDLASSQIVRDTKSSATDVAPSVMLAPTLVGIIINGQEKGNFDALYDSKANQSDSNAKYYLSIEQLAQLTGVTFNTEINRTEPIENQPSQGSSSQGNPNQTSTSNINNDTAYVVNTPIGDAIIDPTDIVTYRSQKYIALSTLKKIGITTSYNDNDVAISLNMGWHPQNTKKKTVNNPSEPSLTIDYYPSKAGLLGLSFDSTLSSSQSADTINNHRDKNIINRHAYADFGAYGYGFGGIWGVTAKGYVSEDEEESFAKGTLNGLTDLPNKSDDWQIDNLYWAKSGEQFATRLGINQPNSLGQGIGLSSPEFTGALLAYSNRNIRRHLAMFNEDSSSLLQNTSQDYQHITGVAEPGGVAELRINGRAIARVQIQLDGRYEFLNLDVNQLRLDDTVVEVAIFAYPLAQQPLEVRTILLGKRRTNTATGELLLEAGLGRAGNLLYNDKRNDSNTVAHIYTEYGLNNRLALRGGLAYQEENDDKQKVSYNPSEFSWHVGANFSPNLYSNLDISYANINNQQFLQTQLNYQRKKLWANYHYQAREYDQTNINNGSHSSLHNSSQNNKQDKSSYEQRHQLSLSYKPNNKTNINFNQYYNDLINQKEDGYYNYTSINHQFNDHLNGGISWNSRDDRYSYRFTWHDDAKHSNKYNSLGLSGDNDSDTLSFRQRVNPRMDFGQSLSHLHGYHKWLYQGDVTYRFNSSGLETPRKFFTKTADNLFNIGYSFFDGQLGWLADWQLITRNGVRFSLGYKHKYVNAIPTRLADGIMDNQVVELPAWQQNNYLYAKLSFDMFKAPTQPLRFGRLPLQTTGNVIVDITHPAEPAIDNDSIRFTLNNQKVEASLLNTQSTHSQYVINNIKAGDYTLAMDAKNLPIEYNVNKLVSPRIRVSNYSPTSVPLQLEKTYAISGKLADGKQGILMRLYQENNLVESLYSDSYGYFQFFGLTPNTYTLKAVGYIPQQINITNDFVMQVVLQPDYVPKIDGKNSHLKINDARYLSGVK